MPKPKARKGKDKNNLVDEKKNVLQKYWGDFQTQCDEYESRINTVCNETCTKIRKLYADRLKKLPENIRNMTLTEYLEFQRQAEQKDVQQPAYCQELNNMSIIRSQYEKSKLDSEKKKTLKKLKSERKRSLSVSVLSGVKAFPPQLSRSSRVLSESSLCTPISKRSVVSTCIVTPKFNPRAPISKACMRRPKAGEVVMSLSGSPLLNFADDIPDKPGVSVSLGGGKVIKITEDTELAKLESEFLKKLDEETKSTLVNVKQKLDLILES